MPLFHGSCHCGRVRFEIDATPTRLSRCNCSICHAKGALYMPIREIQALRITAGESELTAYQFNTRTATHYFCKHCGIHTFHRPRTDPSRWSANVRCLTDLDLTRLPVTEFDGRNWEAAARSDGWIK
ncbi:MAG: GFA family protein [Sulfurifustis sp.]